MQFLSDSGKFDNKYTSYFNELSCHYLKKDSQWFQDGGTTNNSDGEEESNYVKLSPRSMLAEMFRGLYVSLPRAARGSAGAPALRVPPRV